MKLQPLLLALIAASLTHACMEFNGILPFSHTSPFEASIIDNGVTTCWISTTLKEHSTMQEELYSHQQSQRSKSKSKLKKRSNGRKISLTDLPAYETAARSSEQHYKSLPGSPSSQSRIDEQHVDLHAIPPPRNGQLPKTPKMEEPEWDDIPVWQPWKFECISGHKARANVGLRGFTYAAHGQDFYFVPKMKENLWEEKWVYSLKLWCGEKDKKGKVVERPKPKEVGQGKKEDVKKSAAAAAASGSGVSAGDAVKKESNVGKSKTSGGGVAKGGLNE
ncbi:hypothetical protein ONS95_000579 [Cadophora gregata]|uniref:uncharacterized protein n=1 Tax=Cadophora gregata TaxID=51156 RepID=UPI0026DAA5BE|nr:uncharacterized protein ONS95_000579 [Cadophora gregata]KAK0125404.1 hypothetical protein ONS96_009249 [Cadophora gregata f. sp. sojae]KAK0128617.1 hypothetical protein ONS95_000579 [Cadophora gregata]